MENAGGFFEETVPNKGMTHTIMGTEIINSKMLQQNEELKVDFLNDYNSFLR